MAQPAHPAYIRAEVTAKALAKQTSGGRMEVEHQGVREGVCPPALPVLNISQSLTDQEGEGGVGEPH